MSSARLKIQLPRGERVLWFGALWLARAGSVLRPAALTAQRVEPATVGARRAVPALSLEDRNGRARLVGRELTAGQAHVARDALVGAVAGAALAFVVTHRSSVRDHSDDALAYVAFLPAGALAGALVGALASGREPREAARARDDKSVPSP